MARIQIEHGTRRAQVTVTGALTIGRDPENRVVIPDPEVALQHVCIRSKEGAFYVENLGDSKTLINEVALNGSPRLLRHGDQLRLGSALITFSHEASDVAANRRATSREPTLTDPARISFSCECRAVLRVKAEYAGRTAQCKHCGRQLVIPSLSQKTATLKRDPFARPLAPREAPAIEPPAAKPTPSAPSVVPSRPTVPAPRQIVPLAHPETAAPSAPVQSEPAPPLAAISPHKTIAICGVCQCAIEETDLQNACPQCRLPYHAECWTENLGCAAYGCTQVNTLKQGPDIRIGANLPPVMGPSARRPVAVATESAIPWDFLLLSASALGFLLSMVTCGVASLVTGGLAFAAMVSNSNRGKSVGATTVIAMILSCLGFLIGGVVSLIFLML